MQLLHGFHPLVGRGSGPRRFRAGLVALGLLLPALAACSSSASTSADRHPPGTVIQVPEDVPTVQRAVDVANPGDLVLVHPGVYKESVRITKPRIVLRGSDRNSVVLDGDLKLINGITATGAGTVVENLTVRGFLANGVLFTGVTDEKLQRHGAGGSAYDPLDTTRFPPVQGFRASKVTSYGNALYGIYAFDARDGIIEDSYASGMADSGIYVGQCKPCNTLVRGNTVERNAVGIEITNASENLTVVGNRAVNNRVGVTVNSNDLESLAPQHAAVIAGNVVADNNSADSPQQADGGFGIGIGIGGGTDNRVERNLVQGNRSAGIVVTDPVGHPASGNRVAGNKAVNNGVDLVSSAADPSNCFSGNGPGTQSPAELEQLAACGASGGGKVPAGRAVGVQPPPGMAFNAVPVPPAQPSMADPNAPAVPAVDLPGKVDPDSYPLPTGV